MAAGSRIIESPYTVSVPATDIASFVFSSGDQASRQRPQYFDADNPSKCFSLSQARLYVKQIARGLQKYGLQPDDKVLLFSQNQLFFPILFWAVVAAGGVFSAVNPSASQTELEYQLKDSNARILLCHPSVSQVALRAAQRTGLAADCVLLFIHPDDHVQYKQHALKPWTHLWCPPEEVQSWTWQEISSLEEATSKTAILNYSSGTTGLPKGVEISHYNAVANSTQLVHKRNLAGSSPEAQARRRRLDSSGERWIAPLPMYHAYGQTYYCMNAARIGAKVFIMQKYNPRKLLFYLDIYRITFLTAVPVVLTTLSKFENPGMFNLNSIESVVTGSAPLNPEIARIVQRRYLRKGVTIKQGLGMTECTCSLAGFGPDDEEDGKSVGRLNANCRVKIMSVEGEDFSASAPPGATVGELWVSGPNVMKGYYNRPEQTAKSIVYDDGVRWLRTGDVGHVDREGNIYLVDRLKELIKVKGLQVAPAELELALLEHSDVADAAVVGAKIDGGEYPRAFVVRKEGLVTADMLQKQIELRFARHKWLTGGVYFIDAIPRTGSGKIVRRALPNLEAEAGSKL